MSVNGKVHWDRVTPRRPCRFCERGDERCAVSECGRFATCYRVGAPGAKQKRAKDGTIYYRYILAPDAGGNGDGHHEAVRRPRRPDRSGPPRAPVETRDEVYRAWLALPAMSLTPADREKYRRRGLTDAAIDRNGYRSYDPRRGGAIVRELTKAFSAKLLATIPGIAPRGKGLNIVALPGQIIPVRDEHGRIVALVSRPAIEREGRKYLMVSGSKQGGPSSGVPCHVPLGVAAPADIVRVTEGPLKADVAFALDGLPTLGVGGVGNWRPALRVARALGARTARIAYDADLWANLKVARALIAVIEGFRAAGIAVEVERWDIARGKGIDDLLAAGHRPELLAGDAVDGLLRRLRDLVGEPPPPPAVEPDAGDDDRELNEAVDDPYRLARIVLARYPGDGGPRLAHYRDDFYLHDGAAYRPAPRFEKVDLARQIKAEFNRANRDAIAYWATLPDDKNRGPKPVAKKVTRSLVADVAHALASLVSADPEPAPPFWRWPADRLPDPTSLIPMRNGLLEVAGDRPVLRPHTANLFSLYALPYDYRPDAPPPRRWLKLLDDQWGHDPESIDCLHEQFGYLLTSDTGQQRVFLWIGPSRSGRGTMRGVLSALCGPRNVGSTSPAALGGQFGLEGLLYKTVAVMGDARTGETADSAVMVDRILRISGEDPLDVNRKNRPMLCDVTMRARLVILSNELPNFRDAAGAITERYLILNTTRTIPVEERDHNLTKRIIAEELSGIFNLALEGLRRLRARGHFVQPASGADLLDLAKDLASQVRRFVEDLMVLDKDAEVPTQECFEAWSEWARARGYHPGNDAVFGKNLKAAFPSVRYGRPRDESGRQVATYFGLGRAERPAGREAPPLVWWLRGMIGPGQRVPIRSVIQAARDEGLIPPRSEAADGEAFRLSQPSAAHPKDPGLDPLWAAARALDLEVERGDQGSHWFRPRGKPPDEVPF